MSEFLSADQMTAKAKEAEVKSLYLQGFSHSAVSILELKVTDLGTHLFEDPMT